jgi:hypothetical protein
MGISRRRVCRSDFAQIDNGAKNITRAQEMASDGTERWEEAAQKVFVLMLVGTASDMDFFTEDFAFRCVIIWVTPGF